MKRSRIFTGLAAMALSIGLVLAGCEGPTGADGAPGSGGGGGGGGSGPIEGSRLAVEDLEAFSSENTDAVRPPPGVYALLNYSGTPASLNGSGGFSTAVYEGYTFNLYGSWHLADDDDGNNGNGLYVGGTLNVMAGSTLDVDFIADTGDTTGGTLYIGMATGAATAAGTVNVKAGGTLTVDDPGTFLLIAKSVADGDETYEPIVEDAEALETDLLANKTTFNGASGVSIALADNSVLDTELAATSATAARALAAYTKLRLPNITTDNADVADGALTVAAGNKLTVTTATYEGITALNIYGEFDGGSNDPTFAAVTAFTLGPKAVIDVGTGAAFTALTTLNIGADAELDLTGNSTATFDALTSLTVNGTLTLTNSADLTALLAVSSGTPISGAGDLDASAVSAGYTAAELAKLLAIANVEAELASDDLDADLTVPTGSTLELSNGSAVDIADGVTLTVNGELILPSGTDLTLTGVGDSSYSATFNGSGTITINSGAIKVVGAIGVTGETDGDATLTIGGTLKVDVKTANAITVTGGAGEDAGSNIGATKGGAGAAIIIASSARVDIPAGAADYISAIGGAGGDKASTKSGGGGGGGAVIVSNGRIFQNGTIATANTASAASNATGGSVKVGQGAHAGVAAAAAGADGANIPKGEPTAGVNSTASGGGAGGSGGDNSTTAGGSRAAANDATYAGGGGGGSGDSVGNSGVGGGGGAAIKLTA